MKNNPEPPRATPRQIAVTALWCLIVGGFMAWVLCGSPLPESLANRGLVPIRQ